MICDLTSWPTVHLGDRTITVPLPKEGRRGHHVCAAGCHECESCIAARELSDRMEWERMMEMRTAPCSLKAREVPIWE